MFLEGSPWYVGTLFILATALTLYFLYKASNHSSKVVWISVVWILIQSAVSLSGFYQNVESTPPRFPLLAGPAVLFLIGVFILPGTRAFIRSFDRKWLIAIHLVRVPVELCLFWLFLSGGVPEIMTFEGSNFDILSGISAGGLLLWVHHSGKARDWVVLIWNTICLFLLGWIVYHAIFSVPMAFQLYGFEQPNVAVLYFPFTLLPAYVVPVVLFSHLAMYQKVDK